MKTSFVAIHQQLPTISIINVKQDILREVVMKYLEQFYPNVAASSIAIDNKIEQAMDLVKSHLMFAVREEVEVLKEKISELMDRINQLEKENTILKQNATQETLLQLSATVGQPKAPSVNPSYGPVS